MANQKFLFHMFLVCHLTEETMRDAPHLGTKMADEPAPASRLRWETAEENRH